MIAWLYGAFRKSFQPERRGGYIPRPISGQDGKAPSGPFRGGLSSVLPRSSLSVPMPAGIKPPRHARTCPHCGGHVLSGVLVIHHSDIGKRPD